MCKKFVFLIIFIAFAFEAFGQPLVQPKKRNPNEAKWEVSLGFSMGSTSLYYDNNGNTVSRLLDTLPAASVADTTLNLQKYTFQISNYVITPSVKYKVNEDLDLGFSLSLSSSFMEEKYTYDSLYEQKQKAKFSLTQVDFAALNIGYRLLPAPYEIKLLGSVSMPFGFHKGQTNDPHRPFLSDGAFEAVIGPQFKYIDKEYSLTARALYNWRDEDLKPRMNYYFAFGLLKVKDTELGGFLNAFIPIEKSKDKDVFDIRHRPLNEETYQAGFFFKIIFDNDFFTQVGYNVNIVGNNTFGWGVFNLTAGVRF